MKVLAELFILGISRRLLSQKLIDFKPTLGTILVIFARNGKK